MNIQRNFPLKNHNSFALSSVCAKYYTPQTIAQLKELVLLLEEPFYILGEGSNTLFVDEKVPNIVHPNFTGIEIEDHEDSVLLTASCAENWHSLVTFCVEHHYYGIENLALIPGSVGAAPVQNIGAYGVELSDVVEQVTWFDFSSQSTQTLTNEQCQFSYRDSIFKRELFGKGIIIDVTLRLSKNWQPKLTYQGLHELAQDVSAFDVFQKVIAIRQAKLPDPQQIPNAGSFFKNPLVEGVRYQQLVQQYPDMPAYHQQNTQVKLAAGWLIEQCGLKGYQLDQVGVHDKQALVLINLGGATGQSIVALAKLVQQKVFEKFAVHIEPEVRMLSQHGLLGELS